MDNPCKPHNAYSLMELLMVIVIIGMLTVVARPKILSYVQNERVRTLDRRIKLDLAMARSEAIKRRSPVTLRFDLVGGFYEIPALTNVKTLDGTQATYRVALDGDVFKADVVSVNFGGTTEVTFDAFGTPDSTGTIVIGSGSTQGVMTIGSDGTQGPTMLGQSGP